MYGLRTSSLSAQYWWALSTSVERREMVASENIINFINFEFYEKSKKKMKMMKMRFFFWRYKKENRQKIYFNFLSTAKIFKKIGLF